MDSKKTIAIAQDYFLKHPHTDVFFFTSDGLAFFEGHIAQLHTRSLDDKDVVQITRAQYQHAVAAGSEEINEVPDAADESAADESTAEAQKAKSPKKTAQKTNKK